MPTILELKDKRTNLLKTVKELRSLTETEKRSMTDEERSTFDTKMQEIDDISRDIKLKEEENKEQRGMEDADKQDNMKKKFIQEELRSLADNKVKEVRIPVETRALTVAGGHTVQNQQMDIITALEAELIAPQLGCEMVTGLRDNVKYPILGEFAGKFLGEVENITGEDASLDSKVLSPFRVGAIVNISNQLLMQDSANIDSVIKMKIKDAIKQAVEAKMFSADAETSKSPAGLLKDIPVVNIGESIDWVGVVKLEGEVDSKNASFENMAYIVNAKGKATLKSTTKDNANGASGRYLLEGDEMNGAKTIRTNHLKNTFGVDGDDSPIVFGNFKDVVVCQWGDITLVVDNLTQAGANTTRFIVNSYWNFSKKHTDSFAMASFPIA